MARDRKRAKQRRARQSVAQRQPRRQPGPPPSDPPAPAEHASADAEIAEEAIAGADVAEWEPHGPLQPEELPQPDELEGIEEAAEEDEAVDDTAVGAGARRALRNREPRRREGNRVFNFLRACWAELQRVQWPDRRQVIQATAVTIGFVAIAGGYLGAMDAIFSRLVNAIL